MRKSTFILSLFALCALAPSCSNDDGIYVSVSGEGSIVIEYNSPDYLSRMIYINSSQSRELYLMGNTAYINADQDFLGRGAVVHFTMPADPETLTETLEAETFTIDGDSYAVEYSEYANFNSGSREEQEYTSISSGTVVIRRSGSYYDLRLLGVDGDELSVIVAYRGYIYRWFY